MNAIAERWKEVIAKGVPMKPMTTEEKSAIIRNCAKAAGRMVDAISSERHVLDDGTLVDGFGMPVPEA